jgi:Protein of unknown function (DUF1501)
VAWLAGGGVKAGVAIGESDPWSWKAGTGATSGYDLHATILHLLGIDHEKLTVRHDGIDRRLTDVHGKVIREVVPVAEGRIGKLGDDSNDVEPGQLGSRLRPN